MQTRPVRVGDRGNGFGFLRVGGERLLAQHVLARFERGDRPLRVQAVRQRVVDRVDLGVFDERGVGVAHVGDAVLRRERVGAAAVARGHRTHHRLGVGASGFDHGCGRDARRAENADANRVHRAHCKPSRTQLPRLRGGAAHRSRRLGWHGNTGTETGSTGVLRAPGWCSHNRPRTGNRCSFGDVQSSLVMVSVPFRAVVAPDALERVTCIVSSDSRTVSGVTDTVTYLTWVPAANLITPVGRWTE